MSIIVLVSFKLPKSPKGYGGHGLSVPSCSPATEKKNALADKSADN